MANLPSSISSYNQLVKKLECSEKTCEQLLDYLKHKDASVRVDALEILGLKKDMKAIASVRPLLNDSVKEVRVQAALALIRLGSDDLFERLIANLRHPDKKVVIGAVLALGRLGDKRAVSALIKTFSGDDQSVGAAAAWALGECKDTLAIPWLVAAVEHDFVAANACEALGKIGDIKVLDTLIAALSYKAEETRAYCAKSLSYLNFPDGAKEKAEVILILQNLLQDISRKVRLCAAVSLYRLGGLVSE